MTRIENGPEMANAEIEINIVLSSVEVAYTIYQISWNHTRVSTPTNVCTLPSLKLRYSQGGCAKTLAKARSCSLPGRMA